MDHPIEDERVVDARDRTPGRPGRQLARLGRVRMLPQRVYTSDRRIAEWGALKANWIYFKVGMLWAFGLRSRMAKHYPDVR